MDPNRFQLEQEISELTILAMDDRLDEAQIQRLRDVLIHSQAARTIYLEQINIQAGLKKVSASLQEQFPTVVPEGFDPELWQALAKIEQTAEPVEMIREKPASQPVLPVKPEKESPPINKFYLGFLLTATAALIFMVLYLKIDQYLSSQPIAMLVETHLAQWASAKGQMEPDSYLARDYEYHLQSGVVKIRFEYGAELILEGPTIFSCNSKDQLFLQHGKAYAVVPSLATGFTIETPSSRVIDLGTEFGVEVESDGSSNVQVFKGHTSLISGRRGQMLQTLLLGEKMARHVDSVTGHVNQLNFDPQNFIRRTDADSGFSWNGQPVSLSDIVGGGSGFGTGTHGAGINPTNGMIVDDLEMTTPKTERNAFSIVPDNPFVDCVFYPGWKDAPTQISSTGLMMDPSFNIGQGEQEMNIVHGAYNHAEYPDIWGKSNVKIQGISYATPQNPAIYMHANSGITFDLQAIRQSVPGLKMDAFQTLLSPPDKNRDRVNMDVYVLLDNKPVYVKENYSGQDPPVWLDVPIPANSRFLTFVVTQGIDRGYWDWCLFADAVLTLNPNE